MIEKKIVWNPVVTSLRKKSATWIQDGEKKNTKKNPQECSHVLEAHLVI